MDTLGWTLRPASAVVISLAAGVCTLLVCFFLDCVVAGTCTCGWLLDKCNWRNRKALHILLTLAFITCGTLNFFLDGGVSLHSSVGDIHVRIDQAPRYDSGRATSFGFGAALGLLLCYHLDPLLSCVLVLTECPNTDEWLQGRLPDWLQNAAGQTDASRVTGSHRRAAASHGLPLGAAPGACLSRRPCQPSTIGVHSAGTARAQLAWRQLLPGRYERRPSPRTRRWSTSASRQAAEAVAETAASNLLAQEAAERRAKAARARARAARVAKCAQARAPGLVGEPSSVARCNDVGSCEAIPSTASSEAGACPVSALAGPGVAQRVQARYGWRCELIGSALFFDGSDVDIVIEVSHSATLVHAYESVVRATGWAVVGTGAADGQRLVSLHGDFEGFAIDAQVWRGAAKAETPAERKTQEALRATAMLVDGACTRCRQSLCLLHKWAEAAGVKAGQFGLPPGIAWTVAGTMLWQLTIDWDERTDERRLEALLGSLVGVLRTEGQPCIALGSSVGFTSATGSCNEPLCVFLDDTNVCARMTLKTTRALLLVAEGALRMPAAQRLLPESYQQLLSSLLPIALVVQPRTTDAIPRTLHCILAGLDAYEAINALLVTACPATGDVQLRAILDPTRATKYAAYLQADLSHRFEPRWWLVCG